jgi:hypothetical protein
MAWKQQRTLTKGSEGNDKRFIRGEKLEFVRGRLLTVLLGGGKMIDVVLSACLKAQGILHFLHDLCREEVDLLLI